VQWLFPCVPEGAENNTTIRPRNWFYRALSADGNRGRSITIAGTLLSPEKWLKNLIILLIINHIMLYIKSKTAENSNNITCILKTTDNTWSFAYGRTSDPAGDQQV
jgi:hypothetical protein